MVLNIPSDDRHFKSLQHAVNILISDKYLKYIKAIYLYGSYARSDHCYTSDVDVFVFLDKCIPPRTYFKMRSDVTPDDYTLPEVDLHCSVTNEFSDCRVYNDNLKKEAILLWER